MGARRARSLLLLACLAAGCAHAARPPAEAALAARVLPPPPVADAPGSPPVADAPGSPGSVTAPPVVNVEATRPLTLDEAISLAFELQPRLLVFHERAEEARGRADVAFAPFLPQVGLLSRGFLGHNPTGQPGKFALPFPHYPDARGYQTYAAAELNAQWLLWDFGRSYGRLAQAELGIDIAQLQAARAEQAVAYDVSVAYANVLRAGAAVRVAGESVRLAESVLGLARKSLAAGLVERDRVLRAEVELARARRGAVHAARAQHVAVAALNQAVGLNVSAATEVVELPAEPDFELSLPRCLQEAVDHRREIQVARRSIEVAAEGGRVARADYLPRVTADVAVAAAGGRQTLSGVTESAAITLSWGLFQGGRRVGEVRAADAGFRAAVAQARAVCDAVAYEVNEAYRDLDAARQNITLARPAVTQARENLRIVTRRYEAGDATPTDIVDAEAALTRAEQDLYTARYDYLSALARIDYAMGTTPVPACGRGPHGAQP